MDLLRFIFHFGVILAVYNFIWWLIMVLFKLIKSGNKTYLFEVYFIKSIRYVFLGDVIFLFCLELNNNVVSINYFLTAGLILLIYFIGKIQMKQQRNRLFSIQTSSQMGSLNSFFENLKPVFDLKLEFLVLVLTFTLYGLFYFYPTWAFNNIANWFLENIQGIIDAPVFGFIFKVVGFFFLLSVIFKVINAVLFILSGGLRKTGNINNQQDDNHFDDYTEES